MVHVLQTDTSKQQDPQEVAGAHLRTGQISLPWGQALLPPCSPRGHYVLAAASETAGAAMPIPKIVCSSSSPGQAGMAALHVMADHSGQLSYISSAVEACLHLAGEVLSLKMRTSAPGTPSIKHAVNWAQVHSNLSAQCTAAGEQRASHLTAMYWRTSGVVKPMS